MKLAVVGGGSTYTPELVDGLARLHGTLAFDEVALLDPDLDRLEVVGGFAFQRLFSGWLDVDPAALALDHVGLNHLTWIRRAAVDGVDRLPDLLRDHGDALAERLELPRELLDRLGVVPSYYLRYFYAHDEVVEESRRNGTRAAEVVRIEAELLRLYRDPSLVATPALLEQRDRFSPT